MRALMIAQLKLIRTVPVLRKHRGVRRPEAKGLQATDAIPLKADIRLPCKIRRSGHNQTRAVRQKRIAI
jgi:hypothetical protein